MDIISYPDLITFEKGYTYFVSKTNTYVVKKVEVKTKRVIIYFDYDSDIPKVIVKVPKANLCVGNTSPEGSYRYNLNLSERRCKNAGGGKILKRAFLNCFAKPFKKCRNATIFFHKVLLK